MQDVKAPVSKQRHLLRVLATLALVTALGVLATVPLEWKSQAVLGVGLLVVALVMNRQATGQRGTVFLMVLSIFSTSRYLYWRLAATLNYLAVNGSQTPWVEIFFVSLLLGAELYAFVILVLGYFQNVRPLGRKPVPLPANPAEWPAVDVLIPTYNEPLEVIRTTVLAARSMDWPADRLNVFILDDGKRTEVHDLAAECGVGYLARLDNHGAKAGNINYALQRTSAPYVAVFDSDHVPTRSFLQITMGLMVANERLAMVQTPHHFYSPDPFERNLNTFRHVPNENELFYGVVQDGNDFWNAAFFCGSCAVLRRTSLDEVGGVATETVTEDSHTALRLQKLGWHTAYLKLPQAAGLATANISDHITQRIRWARGMVQVLRIENPLFSRQLTMAQRLCYFNSGLHFLHALPRLIFLTAPLVYLLLGKSNLYGYVWAILAYVFPHLIMAAVTNSRIHGRYRHSFWNEVFETVLAPYILLPTLLALVNPRWGKFNVTPKRSVVEKAYFDLPIAIPFLILLAVNALGLGVAITRFNTGFTEPGTLIVNMLWTTVNILILGASIAVLWEKRQLRAAQRVTANYPALILLSDGTQVRGVTLDMSLSGASVQMERPIELRVGDRAVLRVTSMGDTYELPVEVRRDHGLRLGVRFRFNEVAHHLAVTRLLFGRADTWITWNEGRQEDRPLRSLSRLVVISLGAIVRIPQALFSGPGAKVPRERKQRQAVTPALLAVALAGWCGQSWAAEPFLDQRNLTSLGINQAPIFRGGTGQATISFGIPVTKVVTGAGLTLRYRATSGYRGESRVQVTLNGVAVATPLFANATATDEVRQLQVDLPADLIVAENTISLQFTGNCLGGCRESIDSVRLDPSTGIRLTGNLLPIANNLSLLPAPFVDTTTRGQLRVQFVFAAPPERFQLQAAGVISSWFGVMADDRGADFPARVGEVPSGHAIVFALAGAPILGRLGLENIKGPTLALRDNPSDPYGKLLVVTGTSPADLLNAAQALVTERYSKEGDLALVAAGAMSRPAQPFDAPRWMNPDRGDSLVRGMSTEQLRVFGTGSVNLYFRLPPDLSYGQRSTVPLRLQFRTNGTRGKLPGEVRVQLNGVGVGLRRFETAESFSVIRQTLELPVSALYPNNTLTIEFSYPAGTSPTPVDVFPEAVILPATTIDLRGVPRFVQLPRLDLFAQMGFPFTRLSDLAETAVVLPEAPTGDEISLYLTLLGRFGAQTGAPALRVTVTSPSQVRQVTGKDMLVLGLPSDQPLLSRWAQTSPVQLTSEGGVRRTEIGGWPGLLQRIPFTSSYEEVRRLNDLAGERVDGLLQGHPLPLDTSRNAVIVTTPDPQMLPQLILALGRGSATNGIKGSVSLLRDGSFQSFALETDVNYLGRLSWLENFYNWMAERFWLIGLLTILCILPLARWFTRWADEHAELRMEGIR